MSQIPQHPASSKFVVILNKNLQAGVALNAASHMVAGLVARASPEQVKQMQFITYTDKDNNEHPSISALSLIVLRGTSNEIRKTREEAITRGILYVDFLETMTGQTYVEQLERTRQTDGEHLEFFGICLFGLKTDLDEFTRKFSLWR